MKKTIGLIGGMGPMATCDLMRKLVELDPAATDQDHVRIMVDCNTNIPDRTAAILEGGADPVPAMLDSALRLQQMGADVLIMGCNTAHYFYDRLVPSLQIPFLHMIRETAEQARALGIRRAGLLSTDGTRRSGLYDRFFREAGIELLTLEPADQAVVTSVIYDQVKAGRMDFDIEPLQQVVDGLAGRGAEAVILGCTELPVVFPRIRFSAHVLDPTEILARAALRFAGALS